MKTIKRLTVLTGTAVLAGGLLSPSAFAATGVLPEGTSAGKGRDHGYGNCGYNNGGETKRTGQELRAATGMGGYKKGDVCYAEPAPVVVAPEVPKTTETVELVETTETQTDMTGSIEPVTGSYA